MVLGCNGTLEEVSFTYTFENWKAAPGACGGGGRARKEITARVLTNQPTHKNTFINTGNVVFVGLPATASNMIRAQFILGGEMFLGGGMSTWINCKRANVQLVQAFFGQGTNVSKDLFFPKMKMKGGTSNGYG
jgi:hypothetical protein